MDTKQALKLVDDISSAIGTADPSLIEIAMTDLANLKGYLATVDETTTTLNNDVEILNKRTLELQSANNKIMRQLHTQREEKEEEKPVDTATEIAQLF